MMLMGVLEEIEAGLGKLDEKDFWTINSNPLSLLGLGIILFLYGCISLPMQMYFKIKHKVKRR